MSDKEKPKRGYRIDGGRALGYDLRVRIPYSLYLALKSHAQQRNTTPAAAARQILHDALQIDGQSDAEKPHE